MNQSLYASIIKNEINHSLVFLKINNYLNLQALFQILNNFSNILYYDNHNKIITIKLKYPVDLIDICSTIVPKIMVQDRTNELYRYLK